MFLYKNLFFFNVYSFNPNHAYWNQWRLFFGNLPGMIINNRYKYNRYKSSKFHEYDAKICNDSKIISDVTPTEVSMSTKLGIAIWNMIPKVDLR